MTETFRCGDNAELAAYLYDECEPADREAIAAHVARCVVCSAELESLRATRQQLSAWAPPNVSLGFQINHAHVPEQPPSVVPFASRAQAPVSESASWWRQPLPAWAQMAAAVAIFASGLAVGAERGENRGTAAGRATNTTAQAAAERASSAAALAAPVALTPAPALTPASAVTARDLEDLERRLLGEVGELKGQLRAANASTKSGATRESDQALLARVQALINQSEQRQRADLGLRMATVARQLDTQRRLDFAQVQGSMGQMQQSMGQLQTVTGAEARDQRQAVDYLLRVSQRK
jgi:hypothetical protein